MCETLFIVKHKEAPMNRNILMANRILMLYRAAGPIDTCTVYASYDLASV